MPPAVTTLIATRPIYIEYSTIIPRCQGSQRREVTIQSALASRTPGSSVTGHWATNSGAHRSWAAHTCSSEGHWTPSKAAAPNQPTLDYLKTAKVRGSSFLPTSLATPAMISGASRALSRVNR